MNTETEVTESPPARFGIAGIIAKSILLAIALTGAAWFAIDFYLDHWAK